MEPVTRVFRTRTVIRPVYRGTVAIFLLVIAAAMAPAPMQAAECLSLREPHRLTFAGTLSYRIFPGPPNYEDVRKGDAPEPAYIVKLGEPICVTGDEFLDANEKIEQIQVFPESEHIGRGVETDLRRLVGQRVKVEGTSAFGRHTAHHHAPLQLRLTRVLLASDPTEAYGTPMTTVQAFYLALGAGSGDEAARFVTPAMRTSGPLSASALTRFYGTLIEPITLLELVRIHADEYRARYTYVAQSSGRCNGEAVVRTTVLNGMNLIDSVRALRGC